jgi:hypothetical protein
METLNAFIGRKEQPSAEAVAAVLGPADSLWNELIAWMADQLGVATQEWKGVYVHKYGWSLRLKLKQRNILYLGPCSGCFRVSFVLSDKAMAVAKAAKFPKKIMQTLAEAPRYPEGNGVCMVVIKASDLVPIRKLAEIKLAH